ncbi:MAG: response regulator transcription factor [Lachnospiraceae bacterium]|nr:response regulator transcription factor [Lachnospiraceae bacterium]
MIRIAICDDEKRDREQLFRLVTECESVNTEKFCIELFESGEQLLESQFEPDILFLDIIMDNQDGIQVGATIRRQRTDVTIIYITNLDGKIAEAMNRIHSYGYLIKPVQKEELFTILSEAIQVSKRSIKIKYEFFVSENNTIIKLPVTDIYYFEYCNRKIKIVTKDKEYICIKERISDIEDRMRPYGFAMSHQSFVVNLYEVEEIRDKMLLLKNGEMVFLAQKRASTIRCQIMELVKKSFDV